MRSDALGRRLLGGMAVLVLLAGCTGSANTAPTSTPAPTSAATAAPTVAPTSTPIAAAPIAVPTAVPTPTPRSGATGQMTHARQMHTATALADGRVLLAGG